MFLQKLEKCNDVSDDHFNNVGKLNLGSTYMVSTLLRSPEYRKTANFVSNDGSENC